MLKAYGSGTPVAIYVIIAAAVSALGVLAAKETRRRDDRGTGPLT
ncbi:hypothetical protein [Amycolatopsis mediterranei]|uniref:Uncharacterized protein n=1 Tax=Amycolatopsis mediterranei (strain S699) TaxID=713604 RepID=A0A9R0NX51_AMYMS|nr:hypothetical protein [Amycolatopsis mediterranei]AEK42256.1 hypothetical protein RAM_18850 [Amycolatopsis mediterranei S699]